MATEKHSPAAAAGNPENVSAPVGARAAYSLDAVNSASMTLGMAWGLALMCTGRTWGLDDESARGPAHLNGTLRYIATLARDAEAVVRDAPPAIRQAVSAARSVTEVLLSEATVTVMGREGQHWNDEITNWALNAMSDALERAKAAVDDESEAAAEVAHA